MGNLGMHKSERVQELVEVLSHGWPSRSAISGSRNASTRPYSVLGGDTKLLCRHFSPETLVR